MTDDAPPPGPATPADSASAGPETVLPSGTARVAIEYCTQCRWLLRAAWVAQELLQTFRTRLGEVALVPGTGGVFRVWLDAGDGPTLLWDRTVDGGFPEIPDLKRRVRDAVAPDLALGHTERAGRADATAAADTPAPEPGEVWLIPGGTPANPSVTLRPYGRAGC